MPLGDREEPAIVVTKAYDLVLWLLPKAETFPRSYRFSVGERVVAHGLDLEAAAANLRAVRVPERACGLGGTGFSLSSPSGKGVWSKVRVLRGGSFNNDTRNLRVSNRNRNEPDNRNNNIGFRCVRDVERGRAGASAARAAAAMAAVGVRAPLPDRAPGERRAALGAEQQKGPGPVVAKSETRPGPVTP